jgi:hypothetical protein
MYALSRNMLVCLSGALERTEQSGSNGATHGRQRDRFVSITELFCQKGCQRAGVKVSKRTRMFNISKLWQAARALTEYRDANRPGVERF